MGFFFSFSFAQFFCDVVKVESSIGRFSQIWLQAQYEKKTSFFVYGYSS